MQELSSVQFVLLVILGYVTIIFCVGMIVGARKERGTKQ